MKKKTKIKESRNKKDLFGKANYNEQVMSGVKIALVVIAVLGIFYLLTAIKTGEIKFGKKEKEPEEVEIQYEEIIAGQILNRKQDEYYVLIFNFTDPQASYYLSLKDSYKQNTEALPFYIVDLEKDFNQSLRINEGEEYKEKPSKITDLKAISPTILKIKNKKVTERIETSEKVLEFLEKEA